MNAPLTYMLKILSYQIINHILVFLPKQPSPYTLLQDFIFFFRSESLPYKVKMQYVHILNMTDTSNFKSIHSHGKKLCGNNV